MDYKDECRKYVESLGFEVITNAVYLYNTENVFLEIVDFNEKGEPIILYPHLYHDVKNQIFAGHNSAVAYNFENFKDKFNDILKRFKHLQVEIKKDKIKEMF